MKWPSLPERHRRNDKPAWPSQTGSPAPGASPPANPKPSPATARQAAYAAIEQCESGEQFVQTWFEESRGVRNLTTRDRALAYDLACTVIRRRGTLDWLLKKQISRPRENVETSLWNLLRLGACQLGMFDGIPPHAAVHETVELARWANKPEWTNFANGVLRGLSRKLVPSAESGPDGPGPAWLPLVEGRYRRLAEDVFPDPETRPLEYLEHAFSFPDWLLRRWARRFHFEELTAMAFWFNTPPAISLRVNVRKTSRDALLARLTDDRVVVQAGPHPDSILLPNGGRPDLLPGFSEGWFSVQDVSAMQAADLLAPQPGESILDLCSAPGTKTCHLAERMDNRGDILATDIHGERLAKIAENTRRLGLDIVRTQRISKHATEAPAGPFDAILLDAPCSNTGVLGKRPEARWRLQPADLEELATIQTRLLNLAAKSLKPGGRLLYSTCSIEPEENQEQIAKFLREHRDFQQVREIENRPGRPSDGGYFSLLTFTPR